MTSKAQRNKPPLSNVIILLCAAAASLATLAEDGYSGSSSTWASWSGDGQSFTVTVEPVADRLAPFDYDGPLYLDLEIDNVLENSADLVSWTLSMNTSSGEAFSLSGGFTFDEYNGQEDDLGLYGGVTARIAPLCSSAEDSASGCIPCFIEEGCTLTVNTDLCYTNIQEHMTTGITIAQSDGSNFRISCNETPDTEPCDKLGSWIETEATPLSTSLCAEGSLSGELTQ